MTMLLWVTICVLVVCTHQDFHSPWPHHNDEPPWRLPCRGFWHNEQSWQQRSWQWLKTTSGDIVQYLCCCLLAISARFRENFLGFWIPWFRVFLGCLYEWQLLLQECTNSWGSQWTNENSSTITRLGLNSLFRRRKYLSRYERENISLSRYYFLFVILGLLRLKPGFPNVYIQEMRRWRRRSDPPITRSFPHPRNTGLDTSVICIRWGKCWFGTNQNIFYVCIL